MLSRIRNLPFLVVLMGIGSVAMIIPGAHAATIKDYQVMRAFLQGFLLFSILTTLIAIAATGRNDRRQARNQLLSLVGAFVLLPLMLAAPVHEGMRDASFLNTYVEMVSSLTTTGATFFETDRLSPSIHLWRALVGWMGGFLVWVTAVAILAPMNLGGFEVSSSATVGRGARVALDEIYPTDTPRRLRRYAVRLFPIYAGLTGVIWITLLVAGDTPLISLCHAMSTMATSGISPIGGLEGSSAGWQGELIVFLFLVFALSRQSFSGDQPGYGFAAFRTDPEFKIGAFLMLSVPALMFLRHWFGSIEVDESANFGAAIQALWGAIFTTMSFLTTTGFVSQSWSASQSWSGLATPGVILMGLALIGGGVATTAGGVKLLRVYALYKHGTREMDRLVHPSSVGGAGTAARRLRRQGAYVAWVFFMLFALSLALVTVALSLTGLGFESATTLAIASLSTTGPLATIAENPITYGTLPDVAKLILAGAMVLGRLETLAIIALLNPDFWRS